MRFKVLIKKPEQLRDVRPLRLLARWVRQARCDPHTDSVGRMSPSTFLANMIRYRIMWICGPEKPVMPTAVTTCPVVTGPGVSSSWVPTSSRGNEKDAFGRRISDTATLTGQLTRGL